MEGFPRIKFRGRMNNKKKSSSKFSDNTLSNNDTSISFSNMKNSYLKKSKSAKNIDQNQNNEPTMFLFAKSPPPKKLESSDENDKINFHFQEELFNLDYIKRFEKIRKELNKRYYLQNKDIIEENPEDIDESKYSKYQDFIGVTFRNDLNYDIGNENEKLDYSFSSDSENNESDINNKINNIKIINDKETYITATPNNIINNQNKKLKIFNKNKKINPFIISNYSSANNIFDFHKTYRNFKNFCRKHYINGKFSSYAFIKSCDKEKVICNPLGLLKRSGDEKELNLNNQHSGDRYLKCLSNSLKYVDHLNSLEMSSNRITSKGMGNFFFNIQQNKKLIKNLIKLNLSKNNIGTLGTEGIVNFIKDKDCQLENLNIEDNNLGDININKICIAITENIQYKISSINFGKNKISKESEKGLLLLTEKCSEICSLILRNNEIDNNLAKKIISNIKKFLYSIKVLDLSWNLIGDYLVKPYLYEEAVNMHPNMYNVFNNFELEYFKKNMKYKFNKNPLLPIINTPNSSKNKNSKNENNLNTISLTNIKKNVPIPPTKPSEFSIELSNYIKSNVCPLIHLNISHNNLPLADCKLLSEDSKKNYSILGIHVDGNEMSIDSLGFIHTNENKIKTNSFYSKSQITYEMDSLPSLIKSKISKIQKIRGINNCWICDRWKEIEFTLELQNKDIKPKYNIIKIHLDFDGYEPYDMIYKKQKFRIVRMCPPGKIKYFFSVDGNPIENCYKEFDYRIKEFEKPLKYVFNKNFIEQYNNMIKNNKEILKNNFKEIKFQKDIKNENGELIDKHILIYNFGIRNIIPTHNVITNDYQSTLKYSIPRPELNSLKNKNVIPWKYELSIWFFMNINYENFYTDEMIEKAFYFDFNRCNFENDFKDIEMTFVNKIIKENYKNFILCYKNLSSFSNENLFQITEQKLNEFIEKKCDNFYEEKYTKKNLDKIMDVVLSNRKDRDDKKNNNKNFPTNRNNLIRHQFLNLLVKVGIDKYTKVMKLMANSLDSFKLAMEKHFIVAMQGYDYDTWRKEKYYNEEVDNYLKAFLPLIDGIFHTYSKKKYKELYKNKNKKDENTDENSNDNNNEEIVNNNFNNNDNENITCAKETKNLMCFEDFNNFVITFVDHENYPLTENGLIFNISKNLQEDEIYNNDFQYLNLMEFCEALCRVIDIDSPPPAEEKIEDWPLNKRQEQALIDKLENIMPKLYKNIDHPEFKNLKEKFISPIKDQFTSLYVIDKNNVFYEGYEIYKHICENQS